MNAGCIFMDCGASADWSDRNTFVFGHNMRDESMFGAFKNLLKGTASCEENPYFYIYTEDKVYIYEIFSYYETKSTSDRFATFTSDASYDDYVQWATEHSLYASDADLSDREISYPYLPATAHPVQKAGSDPWSTDRNCRLLGI